MSASESQGPERPSALIIVITLAVLMGLQPATTDLYLPALPALKADLGGSMASAQLTLSALMLSFGVAQLFVGPLADRYGPAPGSARGPGDLRPGHQRQHRGTQHELAHRVQGLAGPWPGSRCGVRTRHGARPL